MKRSIQSSNTSSNSSVYIDTTANKGIVKATYNRMLTFLLKITIHYRSNSVHWKEAKEDSEKFISSTLLRSSERSTLMQGGVQQM
jgi:hypothetical protein